MNQQNLPELGQLKWQCRRGVLELDMLFDPFLSKTYPHLSEEEKATFVALLAYPDDVLLSWFFGNESPESSDLQNMIQIVQVTEITSVERVFEKPHDS